ncbi:hypothetical protein [Aquimarina sp. 2304DJ70-9]|uniref:hypothetical protein n=1 Tax=Aquimarina penaris TaxID=3231044 RepID=UPI003461A92D
MKLKTPITIALLWISFSSIGQINTDSQFSNTSTYEVLQNQKPKDSIHKAKKWKKTKRQIRRNKKRFSSYKNVIKTSKLIDTIYINIPTNIKESRLSDW